MQTYPCQILFQFKTFKINELIKTEVDVIKEEMMVEDGIGQTES